MGDFKKYTKQQQNPSHTPNSEVIDILILDHGEKTLATLLWVSWPCESMDQTERQSGVKDTEPEVLLEHNKMDIKI